MLRRYYNWFLKIIIITGTKGKQIDNQKLMDIEKYIYPPNVGSNWSIKP